MVLDIRRMTLEDQTDKTHASFAMLTILETLPEARTTPDVVPNLTIEGMAQDYRTGLAREDRLFLMAYDGELAVGHAIGLMREEEGQAFGYCYTRYVLPSHRRRGLGRNMLRQTLTWFASQGAQFARAHTHPNNAGLLSLFTAEGFIEVKRYTHRWATVQLERPLIST